MENYYFLNPIPVAAALLSMIAYHVLFFSEKMRGISLHLQRTSKQRVYLDKL